MSTEKPKINVAVTESGVNFTTDYNNTPIKHLAAYYASAIHAITHMTKHVGEEMERQGHQALADEFRFWLEQFLTQYTANVTSDASKMWFTTPTQENPNEPQ